MSFFRFRQNQVRHHIKETIARNEENINQVEKYPEQIEELAAGAREFQGPHDSFTRLAATVLPSLVADSNELLTDLKQDHARFVAENRKRSPAFPRGVSL